MDLIEQMKRERLQREINAISEAKEDALREIARKGISAEIFNDVMGNFLSIRREELFGKILTAEGKDVHILKDKALAVEELFDYLAATINGGKLASARIQEQDKKRSVLNRE